MNWWVILSGICWIGAAIKAAMVGNWPLMVVSICYATATFAIELGMR